MVRPIVLTADNTETNRRVSAVTVVLRHGYELGFEVVDLVEYPRVEGLYQDPLLQDLRLSCNAAVVLVRGFRLLCAVGKQHVLE